MKQADAKESEDLLAKMLDPIAKQLMNASGQDMVDNMPEEVQQWFIDTAIVVAVQ